MDTKTQEEKHLQQGDVGKFRLPWDSIIGLHTDPCPVIKNGWYLQVYLRLTAIQKCISIPQMSK